VPQIIISIATMNSRDRLRECLASLPAACQGLHWHAVVVDNCSRDGTAAMIRDEFPSVEVLRNDESRGFGANHNQVLRMALAAHGDDVYALILNDDTVLSPGSIRTLVECLKREPSPGAVTPEVVGSDGVRQPVAFRSLSQRATIAAAFSGAAGTPENQEHADWLNGCCILIPLGVLREVGLFDERFFMYAEDVDLTLRIKARGFRLWQCGESRILHYGGGTTGQPSHSTAMQLQAARSYYLLLRKHRGIGVAAGATTAIRAAHLLRGAVQLSVAVLTGDDRRRQASRLRLRLARYNPWQPVFPDREKQGRR
jgi:GT2 family glycosyltransferase